MDRITILDDELWPSVPPAMIAEAKAAAVEEPCWIARREDEHIVLLSGPPGGPDTATGDLVYIAEVNPPSRQS